MEKTTGHYTSSTGGLTVSTLSDGSILILDHSETNDLGKVITKRIVIPPSTAKEVASSIVMLNLTPHWT